jgi:hypothetical protein
MKENAKMPVGLFNGTVATTDGVYSISDIDVETAKKYIEENGFISAVGHEATAQVLSELLGFQIPMNRIQFQQQVGQKAIALKLNQRPPEGQILNKDEVERVGFTLKLLQRLE